MQTRVNSAAGQFNRDSSWNSRGIIESRNRCGLSRAIKVQYGPSRVTGRARNSILDSSRAKHFQFRFVEGKLRWKRRAKLSCAARARWKDAIARELTESSLFRVDLVALRLANNQFQWKKSTASGPQWRSVSRRTTSGHFCERHVPLLSRRFA